MLKAALVGTYRANANAEGAGFLFRNGAWTRHMYPKSTYTQLNGINVVGDMVGSAITSDKRGVLSGPGFLLQCK